MGCASKKESVSVVVTVSIKGYFSDPTGCTQWDYYSNLCILSLSLSSCLFPNAAFDRFGKNATRDLVPHTRSESF
jgi:hypothetical protein